MAGINTQRNQPMLPMQGIPQPTREEVLNLPRLTISTHPVIAHKLTTLRDKHTPPPEFYRLVKEIGSLLAYVGIIAAPYGLLRLSQAHPDIDIYITALDDRLNDLGYIVPGLGDAGDRQFGTY